MDSDAASREEITRICIPPDRDGRMRPRRREETEETEAAICLSQPSGVLSQDALLISLHFSQLLLLSPLDHLFSQLSLLSASHYFYKYLINIYITSFFFATCAQTLQPSYNYIFHFENYFYFVNRTAASSHINDGGWHAALSNI